MLANRLERLLGIAVVLAVCGPATAEDRAANRDRIKAFCVDFNWGPAGFAPPGMFAQASPAEHVRWYKDLGANTIQTFCVSCCGYAWFRSDVAPVQPGMKGDFLKEMVRLGHQEGMKVMGYFCVGANTHWGKTRPHLSHGTPAWMHIPLTTEYLDYLGASIKDAITKTGIDGFMIDWVFNAAPDRKKNPWLDCEKAMYRELLGESFPADGRVDPKKELEYHRRAVDRCWKRIREATKSTDPKCVIWLSCYDLNHPQVAGSAMFREVDWLMNENPDPSSLEKTRKEAGPHPKIVQCLCGWGPQHDADKLIRALKSQDVGFYGFARPDEKTTLPPTESKDPTLTGNAKNIAIMRKAFRGE